VTTSTVRFEIHAIPAAVLDRVRASGVDVSGHPVQYLQADGGEPLRCCLRNAEPGERAILFGYEPPIPPSPYREIGAVFAHAETCPGPTVGSDYPPAWRGRRQVLRAYDRRGWIHDATREHDGTSPEAVIADMLSDPDVHCLHSRNVTWGCYMFSVTRPGQADPASRATRSNRLR
jgi:hypothetical protein